MQDNLSLFNPIANLDSLTGIRYGVLAGNTVPELLDEIMQQGTNLTFQEWDGEQQEMIKAALAEGNPKDSFEQLVRILDDYCFDAESAASEIIRDEISPEDVVSEFMADAYFDGGASEDVYELATEGMVLQASCLGGAYNIWVLKSPFTTKARLCSPCCPNAGDLNTKDEEYGFECYDIDPKEYEEAIQY